MMFKERPAEVSVRVLVWVESSEMQILNFLIFLHIQ